MRIVGRWTLTEGGAVGDYTFAGNGRYSYGGVGASSGQHPVGFDGDGSYSASGSRLTMVRRGVPAQEVAIRFVQVNQGGTGWTERLCMVKTDAMGMENEACYRRQDR